MMKYLTAEFQKLKRDHILLVAVVGMAVVNVMSLMQAGFAGSFTFSDYSDTLIWNHTCFLYPVLITLVGGYLADREYKNHTLKNMCLIPVGPRALIVAKLACCLLILLALVCLEFVCSVTTACLLRLALGGQTVWGMLGRQLLSAASSFAASMPIMLLSAKKENGYLAGVLAAAFLGFCGMFLAPRGLCGYYPMTAGLELIGFGGPMLNGGSVSGTQGAATLFVVLAISAGMIWGVYGRED